MIKVTCKGVMIMMTVDKWSAHYPCSSPHDAMMFGRDNAERRKANKDILFYLVGVFLPSVVIINTYILSKIHVLHTGCVS